MHSFNYKDLARNTHYYLLLTTYLTILLSYYLPILLPYLPYPTLLSYLYLTYYLLPTTTFELGRAYSPLLLSYLLYTSLDRIPLPSKYHLTKLEEQNHYHHGFRPKYLPLIFNQPLP